VTYKSTGHIEICWQGSRYKGQFYTAN